MSNAYDVMWRKDDVMWCIDDDDVLVHRENGSRAGGAGAAPECR